jgi:arylsulfatase A-like enzyme
MANRIRLRAALPGVLASATLLAQAAFAQVTNTPPPPATPKTPSIVLVLADDLGWGDLGCYGQKKIRTPNLDRLAAEGMRFTQFYAGAATGTASRCALLTGRHTGRATLRSNAAGALGAGDITIAEVLRGASYRTGAFGRWALGAEGTTGEPTRKGFEEWAGFIDTRNTLDYFPPLLWRNTAQVALSRNQLGQQGDYAPDVFTTAATNYIRIYQPARHNQMTPFFLYFATPLPHANPALALKTGNGMQVPSDAPYSAEPWAKAERDKAAMITRLDADVGKLLATLKHHRLDTSTLVLFTSDNGPHSEGGTDAKFFNSAGGLRGGKGALHEGGIRVPFIARWTGTIKPGSVCAEPWAAWDLLATACDVIGTKPPAEADGISFLPALLGKAQTNRHDHFYWEQHEGAQAQAVRAGPWKAIRPAPDGPVELYQLVDDLAEKDDVAAKHPEVVARLERLMKQSHTDDARWPLGVK